MFGLFSRQHKKQFKQVPSHDEEDQLSSSFSGHPTRERFFLLRPFFPDLLPLLWTGSQRSLTLDDLETIPSDILAPPSRHRLQSAIGKERLTSPNGLLRALCLRAFFWQLAAPVIPRLVNLVATFGQIWLVQGLTSFVSDFAVPEKDGSRLIYLTVAIYTILGTSTFFYWEKANHMSTLARSAMTSTILDKTLRLESRAAREVGQGAATTYISLDVERVCQALEWVHEMWSGALSLTISVLLLWRETGWATVTPLAIILLSLYCTTSLSGLVAKTQSTWMASIDRRIRLLSSVFRQLLPIKLGAYERPLMDRVAALRVKEVKALQGFLWLLITTASVANLGSALAGPACLGTYAIILRFDSTAKALDLPRIFTILAISSLLNHPVTKISQTLPQLVAGYASLNRIQGFLALPEKSPSPSPSSGGGDSPIKVIVKDGSFGWDDKTPVLKGINLELTPGQLHMVVGSVASGKSTLLLSLLGESVQLKGSLNIQAKKIALATQTPFIYPGTFRANVLLDKEHDQEIFDRVINACGLRQDLDRLPNREQSMLGERGVSLSGGQRQRLSLARAVYADADLILLDDTFSALDGETERHVFNALFGPSGLLKGKTVVLVTHNLHHLSSADNIIVLDSGKITHVGSYAEVQRSGADLQVASATVNKQTLATNEQEDPKAEEVLEAMEEGDDDEMLGEPSSRWPLYRVVFQATGLWRSLLCIGAILVLAGARVAVQFYLKAFASSSGNAARWIAGYAAISTVSAVLYYPLIGFYSHVLTQTAGEKIHNQALKGIVDSPTSLIQKMSSGRILQRFASDIQHFDFGFVLGFMNLALNILALFAAVLFFSLATPWLGLSLLVLGPAYFLLTRFYFATSNQLQRLESSTHSPLYTLFSTNLSGLHTIRAFGAVDFFRGQADAASNLCQRPRFFRYAAKLFLQTGLLGMTTVLAIGLSSLAVVLRESTSAALLGVALFQLINLGETLMLTLMDYGQVEESLVSLERINDFIELSPEEKVTAPFPLPSGSWTKKGAVEFRDYSMKYRDDLPLALNNLSFSLPAGLKIGICGRTGSGKSSLLLALFRAIDPHLVSGQVIIDGVDTASLSLEQLRDAMSIVTQDPFLWHGSVRENLDVEGQCSDNAIWKALKSVGMDLVVTLLPGKLESLIVDEEAFSKGQRQLLCLARALLRKRKIVVLDESTSSMDHLTDEKIRQVVDTELAGSTVLAIAHRISSIVNFDRILLLENGSVLEFDKPQNLLADPSSRFARLAASQGVRA